MPASFTLSEFSELVSAALDGNSDYGLQAPGGGDGGREFDLDNTPPSTPRHTNKSKRPNGKGLVTAFRPRTNSSSIFDSDSSNYAHYPYNYCNPKNKMLIISPPGPGPLPTPILSASMSTVDLSPNCLSLGIGMGNTGCGGTISKSAQETLNSGPATLTVRTSGTPAGSAPSTPTTPRHHPFTLLAKIKRQLSKSNVSSGSNNILASTTGASPDDLAPANNSRGGKGGHTRIRAISLSTGAVPPSLGVAFAPSPSFHSSNSSTHISDTEMFPAGAISAGGRRHRRRSSGSDSVISLAASMAARSYSYEYERSESYMASMSAYSRDSKYAKGSVTSIIGSSSSFFEAINRGRDGRTGRRGSESDQQSELLEQQGFNGDFGFSDDEPLYWKTEKGNVVRARSDSDDISNDISGSTNVTEEQDSESIQSYMPYLPLAMQLERKHSGLKTRVSVEDVASLARSRSSIQSKPPVLANLSQRSKSVKHPASHAKNRKHVPPPLQSSPSRSSARRHPYATALPQPYSPASSASSRSPITPCTPFFTASEASFEVEGGEPQIRRSITEEIGKVDQNVIDKNTSRRAVGANELPDIHVNVLPPTPTMTDIVPRFARAGDLSTANGVVLNHTTSENARLNRTVPYQHHERNRSTSRSRTSRHSILNMSSPTSPPPSGPLPLPPTHNRTNSSGVLVPIIQPAEMRPAAQDSDCEPRPSDDSPETDSSIGNADYANFASDASSVSTSRTQQRAQAAILEANTRANAFDGFFHPSKEQKIGFARKQISPKRSKVPTDDGSDKDLEWTLRLGTPSNRESPTSFPAKSLDVASGPLISMSTRRTQLISMVDAPSRVAPRSVEHLSLRERTKSESALGVGSRQRKETSANEDWTLSLPLPASSARGMRNAAAGMPVSSDYSSVQDSCLEDASINTHDFDSVLDVTPKESTPLLKVEEVVISVPRVVTHGSGIESATRSRSIGSNRRQPTVFEATEVETEDILGTTESVANDNLAKLDALSADLAQFNALLRLNGSELRRSHDSGFRHDRAGDASSSLLVPRYGKLGLKHARSCSVLEVDEPPPKNAILRTASFGDLLEAESARVPKSTNIDESEVEVEMLSTPVFVFHTPLDDNSPTLPRSEINQRLSTVSQNTLRPSSAKSAVLISPSVPPISARNSGISLNSKRSSSGSTSSTVTAKVASVKPRAPLPLASPPSAFVFKLPSVPVDPSASLECEAAVRPGLASGSALDKKRSRSKPAFENSRNTQCDPSDFDQNLVDTSAEAQQPIEPLISDHIQPHATTSSSPPSSATTTPTKVKLPSLTITTTPSTSPDRSFASRRMSSSPTSAKSVDSSSSLTPTLSAAYDSSTNPTPLASSFPAPPSSHPLLYLIETQTPVKRCGISSASPSPKAMVPTLEDRIRQLRQLGMDAVTIRYTGTSPKSSPQSVKSGNVPTEKEDIDTDSVCSEAYYSARSSFSSARTGD